MGWQGRVCVLVASCALILLLAAYSAVGALAGPRLDVIDQINEYRQEHGLRELQVAPNLMQSAQTYSDTMLDDQYFGHASRIHASSRYRWLGEILQIHTGTEPDPAWAMWDWIHSPSHRRVMLNPVFRWIGAGYTTGDFWGWEHGGDNTLWTVHFGRR